MPIHQDYREALGHALDDLTVFVARSGTTSSVIIDALSASGGHRSANRYDGHWVYNATQLNQRKVRTGGYDWTDGELTIDPTWTAPLVGDRIELTSLFPAREQVLTTETSYRTILNRTLARLLTLRELSLPIEPGQTRYSLAAWERWLDRPERFGWPDQQGNEYQPRLLEPGPTAYGLPIPADWRRPRLRLNAEGPYLEIEAPFAARTTGVLTLRVMSPSDTWIAPSGGAYAESSVGLSGETDAARPSVSDVVTVGTWEAIKVLTARGATTASGLWADLLPDAQTAAYAVRSFDRTQITAAPAPQQQQQAPAA